MMKINFKSPRYVLPLILLPFFLLLFYTYKSSFGKAKPLAKGRDRLQDDIAEVSDQVKKTTLADKLDAYREQYKKADGYTAINQVQQDTAAVTASPSLYNGTEKRKLDAIRKAMARRNEQTYGFRTAPPSDSGFPDVSYRSAQVNSSRKSDEALAQALNRMRNQSRTYNGTDKPADPMTLFRQQMAVIDSMERSHDPQYQLQQTKAVTEKHAEVAPAEKALPVQKARYANAAFNTIMPERHDDLIRAIVDQDITGYAGSRLRIRLLEDMMAGSILIRAGSYLYAEITGFTDQRVLLSINSILQRDRLLPVKLLVYDNDGLPGLYVPASAFRDFSRDLGSSTSQGLTLQQSAGQNSQLVMSVMQRMFESTTSAVAKLIRQNKAKLKYNTLVYLIDPQALHRQQQNF